MVGDNGREYIYICMYVYFAQNPINSVSFSCCGSASCAAISIHARSAGCTRVSQLRSRVVIGGGGRNRLNYSWGTIDWGWIKIEKRTYFKYELSRLEINNCREIDIYIYDSFKILEITIRSKVKLFFTEFRFFDTRPIFRWKKLKAKIVHTF